MSHFECDACHARIAGEPTRLAIQLPHQGDYSDDRHLCGLCSARLMESLTSAPATAPTPPARSL